MPTAKPSSSAAPQEAPSDARNDSARTNVPEPADAPASSRHEAAPGATYKLSPSVRYELFGSNELTRRKLPTPYDRPSFCRSRSHSRDDDDSPNM